MKPKPPAPEADHPTEDDIAQAELGGPRGSRNLPPAPMTPEQKKQMPPDDYDPGHTA
jgi:hypothetical protein